MITHNLIQGSPEWLAYRAQHFNASDAPAMMGCSPHKTRAQLLREMHTGLAPEVDIGTQKRFDNGHRAEALARPLAEEFIGAELYPVTGSLDRLSASFDGLTLDESEGFEHKALNAALRAAFGEMTRIEALHDASRCRLLPIYHRVQMEQQLLVSGAERILFMASEWTADDALVEEQHCWYYPDAELRQAIVDGWLQFERDLAAYVPPESAEPARAETLEHLPAVSVRLDGALSVAGNLPSFAVALRAFVERIPKAPTTDTEFATCDAACKALKKAEEALDAAEAGALASITDVEAMRRAVADCRKLARDTRLAAEKMVERRKVEIKEQAVMAARRDLDAHVAALNGELAPMALRPVVADFAGAIKGLRSFASLQDALDTTLARAKIEADNQARGIRANVATFAAQADGLQFLFADLAQIVHKAGDDFGALVSSRIAAHKAAEAERERKRAEAEQARVAAEAEQARVAAEAEQARVAAEAQRLAAEQIRQAQEAERAALAAQQQAATAVPAPTPAPTAPAAVARPVAPIPTPADPATLKLGTICDRLGFIVRADFLADTLHIRPASKADGRPGLYTERQFAVICSQLVSHVSAMAELYAGEPA